MKSFGFMMNTTILNKMVCVTMFSFIVFLLVFHRIPIDQKIKSEINNNLEQGWIRSSMLYEEMQKYIKLHRPLFINFTDRKPKKDYIEYVRENAWSVYPYSSRVCSNTSNQELTTGIEYCLFNQIYYESSSDRYYFYQDPASQSIDSNRKTMEIDVSYGKLTIEIVQNDSLIKQLKVTAVLTKPIYVGGPIDPNYAHGLLETYGPRFWVLSEIQRHSSYVDPDKIQIYYTSHMFVNNRRNWELYERLTDGSYRDTRHWSATVQAMFSDYPLLTYQSFNGKTVLFQSFITTGNQVSRTPAWDYYYFVSRSFRSHPFHTRQYRRAYLAYAEWLLRRLNLPSKFELTPIQTELQKNHQQEFIPICDPNCSANRLSEPAEMSENRFTGDWIVVVNRLGKGRREMTNADDLIKALLDAFPDQTNPYLRVWPKQFDFNDNLYENARMARSIRLLIGVHGAGLANAIFMRPGSILYEINPFGCRKLSFNFLRWATVFNLQHALWTPSQHGFTVVDDSCPNRQGATTLVPSEIAREVINLIENEKEYRDGFLRRALHLLNDTSLIDYPRFTI